MLITIGFLRIKQKCEKGNVSQPSSYIIRLEIHRSSNSFGIVPHHFNISVNVHIGFCMLLTVF